MKGNTTILLTDEKEKLGCFDDDLEPNNNWTKRNTTILLSHEKETSGCSDDNLESVKRGSGRGIYYAFIQGGNSYPANDDDDSDDEDNDGYYDDLASGSGDFDEGIEGDETYDIVYKEGFVAHICKKPHWSYQFKFKICDPTAWWIILLVISQWLFLFIVFKIEFTISMFDVLCCFRKRKHLYEGIPNDDSGINEKEKKIK